MQSAQTLNVKTFIDDHRFTGYQWLILILCFLILAADGFDTAAIGYIAPALLQEWHTNKSALAPVLSAALFGLAIGAVCAGPMADKIGRKTVLVVSVIFFGIATLATALVGSLEALTILRFIAGLGLGAAMPNAATLMAEFAPERSRSIITNTMFCGFPLGAAGGGMLAAWLIPAYGWRSVMVVGGVFPVLLGLVLLIWLPESVRYMVAKGAPSEKIRKVLSRLMPKEAITAENFVLDEAESKTRTASSIGLVLSKKYLVGSVMLWLAYFMGLVVFYLLTSWMPILMKDVGFSMSQAAMISALFPLGGGFGAIASGWLMDRTNPNVVIGSAYLLTGVAIFSIGYGAPGVLSLIILIFVAGMLMNGAQSSMPALAAAFYPTNARATGVSWMMGIGRCGGIAGALIGAELMRRSYGFSTIFMLVAIPAVIAAAALYIKLKTQRAEAEAESRG